MTPIDSLQVVFDLARLHSTITRSIDGRLAAVWGSTTL